MHGMDVGASVQQQCDDPLRPPDYRAVQRRASCAVAAMHECRVGIEELADAFEVSRLSRQMNRVIRVRRGQPDAGPGRSDRGRDVWLVVGVGIVGMNHARRSLNRIGRSLAQSAPWRWARA